MWGPTEGLIQRSMEEKGLAPRVFECLFLRIKEVSVELCCYGRHVVPLIILYSSLTTVFLFSSSLLYRKKKNTKVNNSHINAGAPFLLVNILNKDAC